MCTKTKCVQKSNFLVCNFFKICNKFELLISQVDARTHTRVTELRQKLKQTKPVPL